MAVSACIPWPSLSAGCDPSMPPVLDIAAPLREFGGDPLRAQAFAAALGFQPVASPVDLLGSTSGETPVRSFFRARGDDFFGVHSLFRVGGYGAGAATAGLYVAELQQWGDRSGARDRARRRVARAVIQHTADARALIVLAPQGLERMVQHEIELVLPRVRADSDAKSAFTTVRALSRHARALPLPPRPHPRIWWHSIPASP